MNQRYPVLLLAVCLGALGCHSGPSAPSSSLKATVLRAVSDGPDSLIGQYGVADKGVVMPFVRVSRPASNGPFVLEGYKAGHWQTEKATGRPLTKEEFVKLVGAGVDVPFTGIVCGQAALIKVPEGWQHDKFTTRTGYIFFWILGPLELTRM